MLNRSLNSNQYRSVDQRYNLAPPQPAPAYLEISSRTFDIAAGAFKNECE